MHDSPGAFQYLGRHFADAAAPGERAIALLRRATQLEKPRFDRAVLALASFGSVELPDQLGKRLRGRVGQIAKY